MTESARQYNLPSPPGSIESELLRLTPKRGGVSHLKSRPNPPRCAAYILLNRFIRDGIENTKTGGSKKDTLNKHGYG